jgi:hypothetical protein
MPRLIKVSVALSPLPIAPWKDSPLSIASYALALDSARQISTSGYRITSVIPGAASPQHNAPLPCSNRLTCSTAARTGGGESSQLSSSGSSPIIIGVVVAVVVVTVLVVAAFGVIYRPRQKRSSSSTDEGAAANGHDADASAGEVPMEDLESQPKRTHVSPTSASTNGAAAAAVPSSAHLPPGQSFSAALRVRPAAAATDAAVRSGAFTADLGTMPLLASDPPFPTSGLPWARYSVLVDACRQSSLRAVEQALTFISKQPDALTYTMFADTQGNNSLHVACHMQNPFAATCVRLLLCAGASPNATNGLGQLPAHIACQEGLSAHAHVHSHSLASFSFE